MKLTLPQPSEAIVAALNALNEMRVSPDNPEPTSAAPSGFQYTRTPRLLKFSRKTILATERYSTTLSQANHDHA